MKFKINQEEFEKALSLAAKISSTKTNLAVLGNVLIEAQKAGVLIVATNLEEAVVAQLAAKVEKEGKTTVSARSFWEFVSSLSPKDLSVSLKDNLTLVSQGSFEATFNTISPEEFPAVPRFGQGVSYEVEKGSFLDAVSKVSFASSTDEGRPALTGTLFEVKDQKLGMIATDGYRLSAQGVVLGKKAAPTKVIVPSRMLLEMLRVASEKVDKDVIFEISEGDNQIIFKIGNIELISRLLSGEFPAWEKIVPKEYKTRAVVDREEFYNAVKIASIFARDSGNVVKITVSPQTISLSTKAKEVGAQRGEVEAKVEGPGGEIAFNYRYLLDILNVISTPNLIFEMVGPLNPGVFRQEKDDFLHIIMPVRVQT